MSRTWVALPSDRAWWGKLTCLRVPKWIRMFMARRANGRETGWQARLIWFVDSKCQATLVTCVAWSTGTPCLSPTLRSPRHFSLRSTPLKWITHLRAVSVPHRGTSTALQITDALVSLKESLDEGDGMHNAAPVQSVAFWKYSNVIVKVLQQKMHSCNGYRFEFIAYQLMFSKLTFHTCFCSWKQGYDPSQRLRWLQQVHQWPTPQSQVSSSKPV